MKIIRICIYFLLISTLNQVHYAQSTEGSKWVLSDLDSLKEASSQNKSFAQAVLALCYVHGDKGLNVSMENAHKLAKISADSGHWLGHFTLGYLHRFEPFGPNPDEVRLCYLKAFQDPDGQMVKLAARKDPIASYALGEIFTSDEVRPYIVPDLQLAARHYEVSSQGGYHPASVQFALFKLHAIVEAGMGIERDAGLGFKLLEAAAKKNLPAAHHYLGRSYFKGDGVESDLGMALIHFTAAADRGYGLSQLTVADFYAYGVTGPPKVDLALRYARQALSFNENQALEKIAEYENILSQSSNQLAAEVPDINPSISAEMDDNVPTPPSPIIQPRIENIKDESEEVHLPSVYTNSQSYSLNEIPVVDNAETLGAEKNLKDTDNSPPADDTVNIQIPSFEVLSNGSGEDLCNSAKNLYWGRGVQVDYLGAHKHFLQSANLGNAEASRYLGLMYLRGKGVEKNLETSVEWFEKAANGGDLLAQKNLVTLKSMLEK